MSWQGIQVLEEAVEGPNQILFVATHACCGRKRVNVHDNAIDNRRCDVEFDSQETLRSEGCRLSL